MIVGPSNFSDVGRFRFFLPVRFGIADDPFDRFGEDGIVDDGLHEAETLVYRSPVTFKINIKSLVDRRVYLHQQLGTLVRDALQHETVILPVAFIDFIVEFSGQHLQIQRFYNLVVINVYNLQGQRTHIDIRDNPPRRLMFL